MRILGFMNQIGDSLEFEICDWNTYHQKDEEDEDVYVIQLFGRTRDDHDVCLKITGFTPFFYIKTPADWAKTKCDYLVTILREMVTRSNQRSERHDFDIANSLVKHDLVYKRDFSGFDAGEKRPFLMLAFKSHTGMREYSNMFTRPIQKPELDRRPLVFQRYEANIEPHIRFMHMRNLESCGWVSIPKADLKEIPGYSRCDYNFSVHWKKVNPLANDSIAPFKIMAYDIECISCDEQFPIAARITDRIIQIGFTVYRYGSMKCEERHILTLKHCGAIQDTVVECYQKEKNLIRAYAQKIAEIRPDFKTGYNVSGFDDSFILEKIRLMDRLKAEKLGYSNPDLMPNKFMDEFLELAGRLNNKYLRENEGVSCLTRFEVKELSSSALGDNILKFFQVPGIVSIDMMKVIQRDHRLNGYKLDNVSANFITQEAVKIYDTDNQRIGDKDFTPTSDTDKEGVEITLYTNSTKALEDDALIQIMVKDGYSTTALRENAKYPVIAIGSEKIEVYDKKEKKNTVKEMPFIKTRISHEDYLNLHEYMQSCIITIFWTFAKDDMHHTLMNEYYRQGDPEKIRQIAKYCIKDCKLVNLLMAKLEVIVNNMGMAKVCHVPLSYLFLRGQGVKIFSLVSKECREQGYIIPVLRVNNEDATGNEDTSYEGATVITPKPGIYLQPIAVLDYNALYPNSMRERNLSPECYVTGKRYSRLEGYIYHDIEITCKDKKGKVLRNIDGKPKKEYHKFAQQIISDPQANEEIADTIHSLQSNHDREVAEIRETNEFSDKWRNQLETIMKSKHEHKVETILEGNASTEKKKRKVREADEKLERKLNEMKNAKRMTAVYRDKLMAIQRDALPKAIQAEKAKRFNTSQGHLVRYGILPMILTKLLNKRKEIVARMEAEKDPAWKTIYNALQLAYKITANSLYGQTGAPTSPIFFRAIAACTTATGRERLYAAKRIVEENFAEAEVVYGDTDSIFINFHIKDENGVELTNEEALIKTIALAKKAAALVNSIVPKPQCIVYEKTLHPFILVTKKRYIGLKYTDKPVDPEIMAMGIALKRRDNAPIVKIIVGGIIDFILRHRDIQKAVDHTRAILKRLMSDGFHIDKFILSKALRASYAKPHTIPHKVLADRMGLRDPGNKPQINDRIPYVFVVTAKSLTSRKRKDVLQGELVEHPDYVIANDLKIDYLYYLEHQIIKPATQILELAMPPRQVKKLFHEFINEERGRRLGCQKMDKWLDYENFKYGSKPTDEFKVEKKRQAVEPFNRAMPFIGKGIKQESQSLTKWIELEHLERDAKKRADHDAEQKRQAAAISSFKEPKPESKRRVKTKAASHSLDNWFQNGALVA